MTEIAVAQFESEPLSRWLMLFAREFWLFARSFLPVRGKPRRRRGARGAGPRVVVIPGLMANDRAMQPMRLALRAAGYPAYRWCLGRNRGATTELFEQFDARIRRLQRHDPAPLILVGWSLGGLIAREYAKRAPDRVAAVVTLGSPFSGDMRATLAARLYRWVAGHPVTELPVPCSLSEKPPVPTAAIWSRDDGVVPAASARGLTGEADCRIEIACAHLGFPTSPASLAAILDAIERCRGIAREPRPGVGQPALAA